MTIRLISLALALANRIYEKNYGKGLEYELETVSQNYKIIKL